MSRRFPRKSVRKAVIAVFLAFASGVQASDDRNETLGEALICMCGCTQLLGACNMINCSMATPMRAELKQMIEKESNDQVILTHFTEKYGPRVLSAPPIKGWFNISAWMMPFAALVAGGALVIFFLRRLKPTVEPATPQGSAPQDLSRYDAEIEEELKRLTPED